MSTTTAIPSTRPRFDIEQGLHNISGACDTGRLYFTSKVANCRQWCISQWGPEYKLAIAFVACKLLSPAAIPVGIVCMASDYCDTPYIPSIWIGGAVAAAGLLSTWLSYTSCVIPE